MTCRCGTSGEHAQRQSEREEQLRQWEDKKRAQNVAKEKAYVDARIMELQDRSPNPDVFHVDEAEQVGEHLVLRVQYPGCKNCSYDKKKVMVFFFTQLKEVLKWRRIDPHFREELETSKTESPSPAARFPGSEDGWRTALEWAQWVQDKK